ncbi:MAG: 4Fe-4S binding protein [Actinobacteria bacterium]|nr:4Fe-4S binding protein [Actinomycetota bacterium]
MKGRRRAVHWVRRAVQLAFIALFVAMAWAASYPPSATPGENLFLRVDPLAALAAARWSGAWLYLLPAWILLGLTLLSGRFFCGWICPLGSALEMTPSLEKRRRGKLSHLRPKDVLGRTIGKGSLRLRMKYPLLAALLILLLVGVNALWIFDPLVVANRAVVFVFLGSVPVVIIAMFVLAAVVGPRFWCQEMCPLGACLSAVSMAGSRLPAKASPLALVKDHAACTYCGRCALACPFGIIEVADSERTGRLALADCALCGECVAACPEKGALSLRVMGARVLASGKRGMNRKNMEDKSEEAAACGI